MNIFLLLNFFTASAWKCTGHMLVALIAELSLISQDPKAYSEASLVTSFLNDDKTSSSAQTFVESACWADDLKRQNIIDYNPYHYYDQPYFPSTHFNITLPSENILSAWNTINPYLKSTPFDLAPFKSSFFLRFLLHLAGDLHQPMHCISLFSKEFPEGDLGGTLFEVMYKGSTQLHLFWDTGAGLWEKDFIRPLSGEDRRNLLDIARGIIKEWPESYFVNELKQEDVEKWCQEGYDIAVKDGYGELKLFDELSEEYLATAQKIVRKRIALGGYRLAKSISLVY